MKKNKEILYVRVTKENRDYARSMKALFGTESRYIDTLLTEERKTRGLSKNRKKELSTFEKIKQIISKK